MNIKPNLRRFIDSFSSQSLAVKFLLPVVVLMLLSLLISTALFVMGTQQTRNRILKQQTDLDADIVSDVLNGRGEDVNITAQMLAKDPKVAQALVMDDAEASLNILNQRAIVIRDRFQLDLIQIYNQKGEARANLVNSVLFRQSSLLDEKHSPGTEIKNIDGHLLMISSAELPGKGGVIITGIDLASEINRITRQEHIKTDIVLKINDVEIGARPEIPVPEWRSAQKDYYVQSKPFVLAGQASELIGIQSTEDIRQITTAGLWLVIASMIITTILLVMAVVLITRSITHPITVLSEAAKTIATGNLHLQVQNIVFDSPFMIGQNDEIGYLAGAFNHMATELKEMYSGLEKKVEERTRYLKAATEVARAASVSLDVENVLKTSVNLISQLFGYYHVGIFVIESGSHVAVLKEASSEEGKTLIAHRHRLKIGSKSLIGEATATSKVVIADNVESNPNHYRNPFLPRTRSEAVFPLLAGNAAIGALDVQSTEINMFGPEDIAILQTLADQIAIAVQNARLYEKQMASTKRLAEVDQVKNRFLANISAELRNPLSTISLTANMLLKEGAARLDEAQVADIAQIYESSQQLNGLINNLIDISGTDFQETPVELNRINLTTLIHNIVQSTSLTIKNKPVNLLATINDDLPTIISDPIRIRQIIQHLLANAIKFTAEGYIIVRAKPVELLNQRSGLPELFVEISVSDTGPGIAHGELEMVFEPFTRSSTDPIQSGSGLGLSVARNLVNLCGGRIWAESQLGHGSVFTFIIPANGVHSVKPAGVAA